MTLDEGEIRAALEAGRFELHYQPQVDARSGALVGAEALVRLRRCDGPGFIAPSAFIERAERSGVIHELGLTMFRQGCADALLWPRIKVALNVSPLQFRDQRLADHLVVAAAQAGVAPGRIEIEITEGLFFDDADAAERALRRLSAEGFSIALDDFGTGYSSLAYLLRFPVDKLKIDRSFIDQSHARVSSATIVHALVALARSLGLKVVAEGVEHEQQRVFLRTAGCHTLQGFLISPALSVADMSAFYSHAMAQPMQVAGSHAS